MEEARSMLRHADACVIGLTAEKRQQDCRTPHGLEAAEEFVEFVGGVEVGF
jgi:hypothetical protein